MQIACWAGTPVVGVGFQFEQDANLEMLVRDGGNFRIRQLLTNTYIHDSMYYMRRTKEEAAQTRQALLDAALTVFSKQGYQDTRLQDIAEAAGVTRGAIYHHFGGKNQLFITLIKEASEQIDAVIGDAIATGGSFAEVNSRVLVNSWTYLEENRRFSEVVELLNFKSGRSPELEEIIQQLMEGQRAQVDLVAGYMKMGIEQGELRADLDPEIIARAFIAYQGGVINLWLADRAAFSIKESASALAAIFVQGVTAM